MANFVADAVRSMPFGNFGTTCSCGFKPPHLIGMSCDTWCKGMSKPKKKDLWGFSGIDRETLRRAKQKSDEISRILKLAMEKM